MSRIDPKALKKYWPNIGQDLLNAMCSPSGDSALSDSGIKSDLSLVHFLAQISEECGAGTEMVENMNYSADGLIKTWPYHFNRWTAPEYSHKPKEIANHAYDGRDGNRPNTDDGWNYRGRGGSQVTGRANYARLGNLTGLDLLGDPDLVNDPANFLRCSAMDFFACGCVPYSQPHEGHPKGDVTKVTRKLNGGIIGLPQRQLWFAKWASVYRV